MHSRARSTMRAAETGAVINMADRRRSNRSNFRETRRCLKVLLKTRIDRPSGKLCGLREYAQGPA